LSSWVAVVQRNCKSGNWNFKKLERMEVCPRFIASLSETFLWMQSNKKIFWQKFSANLWIDEKSLIWDHYSPPHSSHFGICTVMTSLPSSPTYLIFSFEISGHKLSPIFHLTETCLYLITITFAKFLQSKYEILLK
jgi:hypothetical protein